MIFASELDTFVFTNNRDGKLVVLTVIIVLLDETLLQQYAAEAETLLLYSNSFNPIALLELLLAGHRGTKCASLPAFCTVEVHPETSQGITCAGTVCRVSVAAPARGRRGATRPRTTLKLEGFSW